MKKIWVITLFPEYFTPLKENGVIGKYIQKEEIAFEQLYLGDYSPKNFKGVDAAPYGGGPGMVMRADVLERAVLDVKARGGYGEDFRSKVKVIYTAPRGKVFNNKISRDLAHEFSSKDFIFICGRYEGIDERFLSQYVDDIYSLGDYVLTGGELAVMTLIDSYSRFIPGVLGNNSSADEDSFEDGLIEGPQYTRPQKFNGEEVPEVLTGGNHAMIEKFQLEKRLEYTKKLRPDLYKAYKGKE